jgi:MoxR-like ATPase
VPNTSLGIKSGVNCTREKRASISRASSRAVSVFATPGDIKFVVPYVYQHRLMLTAEAEMQGFTPFKVAQMLMDKVEVPK